MLRLSAVDQRATALGLSVGQPLANARAMLPELHVVEADLNADQQLLMSIAQWCHRFTPLVALDGARGLFLDVTGACHLFGGEQAVLFHICEKLRFQGLVTRGAMAGTAVAARALARHRHGSVTPPGGEEKAMTPLPITALDLDPVITHALRRAGLKTIGQVAARQRAELVARLGAGPLAILDEALGKAKNPITPLKPAPAYWVEENFAEPIAHDILIRASLQKLTADLGKILEREGMAARHLEALFFRSDGTVRSLAIELGAPTRDGTIIDRLFQEKMAKLVDPLDPGFGFDMIRLCALRIETLEGSAISFESRFRERQEIAFLIDRLSARFGSRCVFVFRPHDSHVPEAAWRLVPAQFAESQDEPWGKKSSLVPRRPLRVFGHPEPVEFPVEKEFLWRKGRYAISLSEGPERIAMEWWRADVDDFARDYFRIEDRRGRRLWLYRSGSARVWSIHGIFA